MCSGTGERFRIFRAEKTYAVKAGRWYFEFEAVTAGDMRVGWSRPGCQPDLELGSDERAFAFDGFKVSSFLRPGLSLLALELLEPLSHSPTPHPPNSLGSSLVSQQTLVMSL